MATVLEIAQKAGVSQKTVSRVINKDRYVNERVRETVLGVAKELDYHPHASAMGLRTKKTLTLGIAMYQINYIMEDYFAALIAGMEEVLGRYDYNLQFVTTHKGENHGKNLFFLRKVKENRLDGLVIADKSVDIIGDIQRLEETGVPFVMVDNKFPELNCHSILADYEQGMFELTQYLIKLGHSKIGLLCPSLTWYTTQMQLKGYKSALEKNNLEYNPILIKEIRDGEIEKKALELVDIHPNITAIIVYDDLVVPDVFGVLRKKGLRVPDDIAVAGFYDFRIARQWHPSLTTVRIPLYDMGARAVERLIRLIGGEEVKGKEVILSSELVIRESSGCVR